MIRDMLKRINSVLPELILELILYGIIVQFAGVWFVADKLRYSTGLWIGVATAIGMAIHMAIVIDDAVEGLAEHKGNGRIIFHSLIRYVAVVIVFFLLAQFKLGNIITSFIGVMGLKAAAYMQPFTHRFILKLQGLDERTPDSNIE